MRTKSYHEVIPVDTCYSPCIGGFARTQVIKGNRHRVDHWYSCRDIFHNILWNLKVFFFCVPARKGRAVSQFMEIIEEKLDVQPRSEFGPTQNNKIIWVKPSVWWTKLGMRRSLLTILLRAGINYSPKKDNFEEAINSDKYLSKTIYAFNRFMAGNTKYAGRKIGWYKQFYDMNLNNEDIDKLLIKPQK